MASSMILTPVSSSGTILQDQFLQSALENCIQLFYKKTVANNFTYYTYMRKNNIFCKN